MASFKDFEEIIAWQQAVELAGRIHAKFYDHRDFSYRDQIRRAATSISSNIAEGFDRGSNKDFRRFLCIAKGSCNEARSLLWVGKRYGYIEQDELDELRAECRRISATTQNLIGSLRIDAVRSVVAWIWPFSSLLAHP
ncbi:MAG: four helix bundle protein [Flavobacteriales bacterium]|nr:four helix bundle protein [Flavobacteriales bacterium]